MKKSMLLFLFLVCGAIQQSFAHYIWLETDQKAQLGKTQEVKVFLGEYTYGVTEKVGGETFEKMKNFTLWVISPSGKKEILETAPKENFYLANFTPQEKGTYTILLNNDDIAVIDYTQYDFGIFKTHYHAMAQTTVGESKEQTVAQNDKGLSLVHVPAQENTLKLQVLYKGEPVVEHEAKLFIKDQWTKTLYTDENGYITSSLPWSDEKYIVEVTKKEETPGSFKGDEYEFVWHCVTYAIP